MSNYVYTTNYLAKDDLPVTQVRLLKVLTLIMTLLLFSQPSLLS
jgi:hypothetical protein